MSNLEFQKMYGHKIVDLKTLADRFPLDQREMRIVLCHGVFDIVHPGHVRHLVYAKSKADILVVSLTADGFISKGHYRPQISQQIRALNLAAFEMVDWVIIDTNPTPIEIIQRLQPDFLAKGFEYGELTNPNTVVEKEALDVYQGQIIFTPGDIVYSSSSILNTEELTFGRQNLGMIIESEKLDINLIVTKLELEPKPKILVVGDTIVDSIVKCTSIGGQVKTPTLSIRQDARRNFVGGAGIVAAHLKATGADVSFISVVGDDWAGEFVRNDLTGQGVDCKLIVDGTRPTTIKKVYVADGYRLLKVDTVDNRQIDNDIFIDVLNGISELDYDLVVFSDFRHGIFTKERIPKLVAAIPPDRFKVADSQVASRWGNITDFRGFNLITPNEKEARFSLGDQESTVINLALELREKTTADHLILKLGGRGSIGISKESTQSEGIFTVPPLTSNSVDPVGAGDALIAYASLGLYITGDVRIANLIGAVAASLACETEGNNPITLKDVCNRLRSFF